MRLIVAFFLCSIFILSSAFRPTFADSAPPTTIKGDWLVDIRTICVVGAVVLGGTWWVAKWMQRVEDRLKGGEVRFTALELKAQTREDLLIAIKVQVDRMLEKKQRGMKEQRE